jgi:hypothetical protein
MITHYDIKRQFLVRQADLQNVDDLNLATVHSIYLDPEKLDGLDLFLPLDGEDVGSSAVEIKVSSVTTKDNDVSYWAISSLGNDPGRAIAATQVNREVFEKVKSSFGVKELKKSRFSFPYLRKHFDLDVVNGGDTLLLNISLGTENELFAIPPFVNIIKEVTGDIQFSDYYLSENLKENT